MYKWNKSLCYRGPIKHSIDVGLDEETSNDLIEIFQKRYSDIGKDFRDVRVYFYIDIDGEIRMLPRISCKYESFLCGHDSDPNNKTWTADIDISDSECGCDEGLYDRIKNDLLSDKQTKNIISKVIAWS